MDLLVGKALDIGVGIISGVILTAIVYLFVERYSQIIANYNRQKSFGIKRFIDGPGPGGELIQLFKNADTIRLCFVAGYEFWTKKHQLVEDALKRGAEIQLLMATERTEYLSELNAIEEKARLREGKKTIEAEIDELFKKPDGYLYKLITKYPDNFQVRQCKTLIRYVFFMGDFPKRKMDLCATTKLWFNIYLPPDAARTSKMFYAEGSLGKPI